MAWTLTGDVDEYLAGAGSFLAARPVEHTIELAAAQTLRARGPAAFGRRPALLGWYQPEGGEIAAAAFHTPPFPLLLSGSLAAAAELAGELAARSRELPGVNAVADLAESFAASWQQLTGADWTVSRRSRLFRLGELARHRPVPPGAARTAGEPDRPLLARWLGDFTAEVHDIGSSADAVLADRLSYGGLTLWENGGRPVSMAGHTRPSHGVFRIGPVFTPAGERGRGYGGAATAAVSQAALDAGATAVVLFTDLANPTSNGLYPRLGYRPVSDRVVLAFGATCS